MGAETPVEKPATEVDEGAITAPSAVSAVDDRPSDNNSDQSISQSQNTSAAEPSPAKNLRRSNQLEYVQRVVLRALWKHPESWPFREPVDPVRDNAKDYFDVVKFPMDLGTIRTKLLKGNYGNVDECVKDIRLIFENCYAYNSKGLVIRRMCETLEAIFNQKMLGMPPLMTAEEEAKMHSKSRTEASLKTAAGPGATSARKRRRESGSSRTSAKKKKITEDPSTSASTPSSGKSKGVTETRKTSSRRNGSRTTSQQSMNNFTPAHGANLPAASTSAALKYCLTLVKELFTKRHADCAWPFYDPVDPNALQLGDYNKIIHYPVDLSTIKKKLESGLYSTAFECITELRRMVTNSCRYNPENHVVSEAGLRLIAAIELLIAKAPADVYDFLVVAPTSIIIPRIDSTSLAGSQQSLAELPLTGTIHHLEEKVQKVYDQLNQIQSINKKKNSKKSSAKNGSHYFDNDDDNEDDACNLYDDDYVNPLASRVQHGAGYTCVETNHAEPMTYEEKRKLSAEINRMPTDKLADIIALLADIESDIFKEKNTSEVEIDFDSMKPETLRQLEKYVKYLNKPQKPRRKRNNVSSAAYKPGASSMSSLSSTRTATSKTNTSIYQQQKSKAEEVKPSFSVVSALPLSEESDYSDNEHLNNIHHSSSKNNKTSAIVHSNISTSKITHQSTSIHLGVASYTTVRSADSTLTFDTIDDSLLPPSMLNVHKDNIKVSPTDLINEAKAVVKQQKMVNCSEPQTTPPPIVSNSTKQILQRNPSTSPAISSSLNVNTTIMGNNSTGLTAPILKPEIRVDTNAPKAPATAEEREKMKMEERQRRLALASGTLTTFHNDD